MWLCTWGMMAPPCRSEHAHEPCAPPLPRDVRRQERIGDLCKARGVGEVARQAIDIEIADKFRYGYRLVEPSDARLPVENRDLATGQSLIEVNKVARPSVELAALRPPTHLNDRARRPARSLRL